MRYRADWICTEKGQPLTGKKQSAFIYHYRNGILLELKKAGLLTEMQYRSCEEALRKQLLQSGGISL